MKENYITTQRWLLILDLSELVNTYEMTSTVVGTMGNTKEASCNIKLAILEEKFSREKIR